MGRRRLAGLALILAAVAAACGDDDGRDAAEPARGAAAPPFAAFDESRLAVTSADGSHTEGCVLVADDSDERGRGLMEVRDLGNYVGMAFEFGGPTDTTFYMRNTPMPLSIAFFDGDGGFVSATDMAPCDDIDGCPLYAADERYEWALEVPQGRLEDLGVGPGAIATVAGRC
jgi:uncharacterized membrane protein (UPF0127 family)